MTLQYWQFGAVFIAGAATFMAGCADGQNKQAGWFQPQSQPAEDAASPHPPGGNLRASRSDRPKGSLWGSRNDREPTPAEVARMIEPNVMGITSLFDPFDPWLRNKERTRITGVKVGALYLFGTDSTGVFGDGIIRPRLYMAERGADGKLAYKLVKEWSYDVNEAMLFRAKKRARWGWGYALFLGWDDMDLAGKDIRLIISFERTDGLAITGNKKEFRVPVKSAEPG